MDTIWLVLPAALALLFAVMWRLESVAHMRNRLACRKTIDAQRSRLNAAEEEVNQLRAAAESADDVILIVDENLYVLYANHECRIVFGDVQSGTTLIRYTRNLELEQLIQDVLDIAGGERLERMVRVDERVYRVNTLRFGTGVALAMDDISEVQRLSRARQDMISNLSHELRTPLTSLRLVLDTLHGPTGKKQDVAQDLIAKASAEVDLLETITQETLDLAAIESGMQVVRLVPLPLRSLVEQAWNHLSSQAARKDVHLQIDIPDDWGVLASQNQSVRAIQNVLHNAIKFSPSGSLIRSTASMADDDEHVTLSILDEGSGIHPDELDRIFERFFRSDRARQTPGTGLGLAISRHIMRAHGGTIWAENRVPPADGAVFHLTFHTA